LNDADPLQDVIAPFFFPELDILVGGTRLECIAEIQTAVTALFTFEVFGRHGSLPFMFFGMFVRFGVDVNGEWGRTQGEIGEGDGNLLCENLCEKNFPKPAKTCQDIQNLLNLNLIICHIL